MISLHIDEAVDLAAACQVLEDWLLHTDDATRAELARFGFASCTDSQLAVDVLVATLGQVAVTLHRQLRAQHADPGGHR